jgi:DNA-binding NtrC family response regulator
LKIELPPLREHRQDIGIIVEKLLAKHAQSGRKLSIDASATMVLENYSWPGNVRELENTVERLMAVCRHDIIRRADVEAVLENWEEDNPAIKNSVYTAQVKEITDALRQARGIQIEAARLLGVHRSTLGRQMKKFGIRL